MMHFYLLALRRVRRAQRTILGARGIAALLIAWVAALAVSMVMVYFHGNVAARTVPSVPTWPSTATLTRARGLPTLVMAAHPLCPCTRASLDELNVIMNRFQGKVTAYVLFIHPAGTDATWDAASTRARAGEIPGLVALTDLDGVESARFHLSVSGQIALYDANGKLVYSGGITGSRGHAGDNAGRELVSTWLEQGSAAGDHQPVYGCGLVDPVSQHDALPVDLPRSLTRSALLERSATAFCGACHTVTPSAPQSLAVAALP
ncbi:MAG TPA: hypothetical protein VF316_21880 [Polyangiaceae bacterium]